MPAAGLRQALARPALEVAPGLLGGHLTTRRSDGAVRLRITEVEAYEGALDPGSHAFRGRTPRNAVMFGPPGHLYVYRHLGLHHCVNVVCGPEGTASAVLLRAGEVVGGAELAQSRRSAAGVCRTPIDLARGPARLTVALALDRADDGVDVGREIGDHSGRDSGGDSSGDNSGAGRAAVPAVELELPGVRADGIASGPRVGVSGDGGDGARFPWRFWLAGDPTVSVYRRAL